MYNWLDKQLLLIFFKILFVQKKKCCQNIFFSCISFLRDMNKLSHTKYCKSIYKRQIIRRIGYVWGWYWSNRMHRLNIHMVWILHESFFFNEEFYLWTLNILWFFDDCVLFWFQIHEYWIYNYTWVMNNLCRMYF